MIKPELYPYTKKANTAKEAWQALRETFTPSDTSGKRSLLKKLFTASVLHIFTGHYQAVQ
jgi:hypothetical protein